MRTEEQKKKHAEYMRRYYHSSTERKEKAKELMKEYAKKNPEKIRGIHNKYYYNNLVQIKARKKVCRIKKKEFCEICGETKNLEKHHWNYNKPRLVNTLCRYCHSVQHSRSKK